ncbi:MAG: lytic murein transglycosylase [Pseudomonadota bacterium]
MTKAARGADRGSAESGPRSGRLGAPARRALHVKGLLPKLGLGLSLSLAACLGPATAQTQAGFERFVRDFRPIALAQGVRPDVFDTAFAGVRLNREVVKLDQRQPEFALPIWKYLEPRVSDRYIAKGVESAGVKAETLAAIEQAYGVEKEVVTAIWGVESFYGAVRGDFRIIEALATLAYEGRRRDFGKQQLIAALKVLQNGDIEPASMLGSWAGAMGHTQFIPTSYRERAVDFNGDGKRDIWSDDPTDALASTANYLAVAGWRKGRPWGFQVRVPTEFNYGRFAEATLSTNQWSAEGLLLNTGAPLPAGYDKAELLLPAGARGPAFLVLDNYRALLAYNNANAYALAVALLSERLGGREPRALSWPVDDRPLSRDERKELQASLAKLGFDAGGVDGIIGSGTKRAIRGFQSANSMIADGYASGRLLDDLRRALAAKNEPLIRVAAGPANIGDIREIQAFLRSLGYRVRVDGVSGPQTERAIAAFLRSRNISLSPKASREVLQELRKAVRAE